METLMTSTHDGSHEHRASDYAPPVAAQPLSDEEMATVRFGRSKMLKRAGGLVFGFAVGSAIDASPILACTLGSPPPGCGPSHECCCCSGYSGCCSANCSDRVGDCGGPGGDGWYVCYNGTYIFCHDYWSGSDKCICRFVLSGC
jgi:hypothetical protein